MPLQLRDRAALSSPLPVVTAAEARMLGVPVRSSMWHRVRPGVYVDGRAWGALPAWQKYQVRVHAFLRVHPDAVLCLESAGVAHGLPSFGHTRDIHVFDPDRRASRRFGDVCVHTSTAIRPVELLAGIHTTTLIDTVVDLARVLPPAHALSVADAAVSPAQGGSLTLDELRERASTQPSSRGRARLSWVWEHVDGRSESPGESCSRAVINWSGFEHPDLQPSFHYEGVIDRTDFFFTTTRGVGESDGWGKYDLADPKAAQQHLSQEKRREDRLRRHGHPFSRWTMTDALRVAPLCRALQLAGVPLVRPAQPGMLATLRTSPRLLPA